MCGCEPPALVCSRCRGTRFDYRYFAEPDPAEVEADRLEAARVRDGSGDVALATTRGTR